MNIIIRMTMSDQQVVRLLIVLLGVLIFNSAIAQTQNNAFNPWKEKEETTFAQPERMRQLIPNKYKTLQLDVALLQDILSQAPMRYAPTISEEVVLSMPMPNGRFEQFRIYDAPIMHPDLAARYPNIHAYSGQSIKNPATSIRFNVTPTGFHAIILKPEQSIFIDPYAINDQQHYISYYKKDLNKRAQDDFVCHVETTILPKTEISNDSRIGDCRSRTYRLALACTGEYTEFHGGTRASALAAMHTTMTRVNGIFEKETFISLELIANNDALIFLDPVSDPYTNNNGIDMLSENQTTCDELIGSLNYDIGHVFSTGGGGIATLRSTCSHNKARGVTGLATPIGDAFNVDYVAHEMGHQFGATHTFNNDCEGNIVAATAVEPGSGSTIMSYAGICAPNVQVASDDYFHSSNLVQIAGFVLGNACPNVQGTNNSKPSIDAGMDYNIPKSTPFELTASAEDPNSEDVISYCWEQIDEEIVSMPPLSTHTTGPLFRSWRPTSDASRSFPNVENLRNNTAYEWEVLPSVARDINFRCIVRDNKGCSAKDEMVLHVIETAGPFALITPNSNETWVVGTNTDISWDVANTNMTPINCLFVDILLSTDGGYTYPHTLASKVDNDGFFSINVPNLPGTMNRIRIEAANNVFFDVSNANFTIEAPSEPTFSMAITPIAQRLCYDEDEVSYNIIFTPFAGFNEAVNLSLEGLPEGANASFSMNTVMPPAFVKLTIDNLATVPNSDLFDLIIEGTSANKTVRTDVALTLFADVPVPTHAVYPSDGSKDISKNMTLEWAATFDSESYAIDIATSPAFGSTIIESVSTIDNFYSPVNLDVGTIYYWRIKGENLCGIGSHSETASFQTSVLNCNNYSPQNLPIQLNDGDATTIEFYVAENAIITDLNVMLEIEHMWIGDLSANLISPAGTDVELFNRPGVPNTSFGCGSDNIFAVFDDEAILTSDDFEDSCAANIDFAINGIFQPSMNNLSAFTGENIAGIWKLIVNDNYVQDQGILKEFSIEVCAPVLNTNVPQVLNNQELVLYEGEIKKINNDYLSATTSNTNQEELRYILKTLTIGSLKLNGINLQVGDQFTQADINANALSYTPNAGENLTDQFIFDLLDIDNGWLPNNVFKITILRNNLSGVLDIVQGISCSDLGDAQLLANVIGGTPPYTYQLNENLAQTNPTFAGLGAGIYQVTITDANGFKLETNSVMIQNPDPITATIEVNEANINVMASGGTGTLSYILNGAPAQSSSSFVNLQNGIYTITVIDENACSLDLEATIAINSLVISTQLLKPISCYNAQDASLEIFASGGSGPYQYSINKGVNYKNTPTFYNLGPGLYEPQILDADGFERSADPIVIDEPLGIVIAITVNDYLLEVNAIGGVGDLTYSIDGENYQSNPVFENLANGDYILSVQDENACIETMDFVIAVNTLAINASIAQAVSCHNASDGSILINVNGGTPPYQYSLDGENYQNDNIFNGLPPAIYNPMVLDAEGFSLTTTSTIILENPELLDVIEVIVTGNQLVVETVGGTGQLKYRVNGGIFQNSNTFTGLPNSFYFIEIRDENDCATTATAVVALNTLSVFADVSNRISCYNENDGSIWVSVAGGTPPYEYSLNGNFYQSSNTFYDLAPATYTPIVRDADGFTQTSNTITLSNPDPIQATIAVLDDTIEVGATGGVGTLIYSIDNINFQEENTFTDLESGVYTVYIKDSDGCIKTMTAIIADMNNLVVSTEVIQAISCHNANDGSFKITAAGGQSPYTYSIDGENYQANNSFDNLSAQNYTVYVKDANDFVSETTINLDNPSEINIDFNLDVNDLSITASGGIGNLKYSLDGIYFQAHPVFSSLANGDYTIYVADENACIKMTTVSVAVNTLRVMANILNEVTCYDGNDGRIEIEVDGGTPEYEYSIDGENFQNLPVFENLAAGSYQITVRDSEGFTRISNTVALNSSAEIIASAMIDGNNIIVDANGGTGILKYSIDGINFQLSNSFLNLPNSIYTIYVEDENACQSIISASILINTLVVEADILQQVSCFGGNDGAISVAVNGGKMPYAYSIDGENYQASAVFDNLEKGVYEVHVRDADNFLKTLTNIKVAEPFQIQADVLVEDDFVMVLAIGGTGIFKYSLDGLFFQTANTFSNVPNGDYTIYILDENDCLKTLNVTVAVNTLMFGTTIVNDIRCNGETSGTIEVMAMGGTAPYLYSLDNINFQAANRFTDLASGTYEVVVVDAENFVQISEPLTIQEPSLLEMDLVVERDEISIEANGGTGTLVYSLDGETFQTEPLFAGLENGTYTVSVKDDNACMIEETATVSLIPELTIATSDIQTPLCEGMPDGAITVMATGGILPYTYSLNGGAFQDENSFENLIAGVYQVTVKDASGGLISTDIITIESPPAIAFSVSIAQNNVTVVAHGGTGVLSYSIDGGITYQLENEFIGLEAGDYTLFIKDENECITSVPISIIYTSTVNVALQWNMLLYPNPTNALLTIALENLDERQLYITIFNCLGELVFENNYERLGNNFKQTIELGFLDSGVYQVRITDGRRLATQQFLIVK